MILFAFCALLLLLPALPHLECGACGGMQVSLVPLIAAGVSGILAALFWFLAVFDDPDPAVSQIAAGLPGVTALMGVSALLLSGGGGFPGWAVRFGPWFFYGLGFFIFAVLLNASIGLIGSRAAQPSAPSAPPSPAQARLPAPTPDRLLTLDKDKVA